MSPTLSAFLSLLGRMLLSAIFLLAGIGKIQDYAGTAAHMESHGMSAVPLLLPAAIAVEIGGGLALLIGWQTRSAALLLFLFLIPTTLIFHHFWDLQGAERTVQMINSLKNLAIMGGLLGFCAAGAGAYSVDGLSVSTGLGRASLATKASPQL